MPDDILKDAIETSRRVLESCNDFEASGILSSILLNNTDYSINRITLYIFFVDNWWFILYE